VSVALAETVLPSPIGELVAVTGGGRLLALDFASHRERLGRLLSKRFGPVRPTPGVDTIGAGARLAAYFAGDLGALDGLPVDGGGTPFQARVWAALRLIPAGETRSYAGLATALRQPTAIRAVARANALNPVAIAVPCHRVIGSDGALRGYAGGLDRKRWLLRHEGVAMDGT
jgi:methylated-DNA-[protein]-cysteine S-methyltransferase